ncbi:hypothetical protein ES703_96061 [subsurface metagenome]
MRRIFELQSLRYYGHSRNSWRDIQAGRNLHGRSGKTQFVGTKAVEDYIEGGFDDSRAGNMQHCLYFIVGKGVAIDDKKAVLVAAVRWRTKCVTAIK